MLSKILKVMCIVILFPLFATCSVMMIGAAGGLVNGVVNGYEEAAEQ